LGTNNVNGDELVIVVKNAKKVYRMGTEIINAVDDVSFEIKKGEFCCLLGTSGSGKSTLLNLMAGIEKITSGEITIKGKRVNRMSENSLARFRQRYLGFVFQAYNLLPTITALENVEFPLIFKRVNAKKRRHMAKDMLERVGLGKRLRHKPTEMSGGQQQRVGIARAFVAKPEIIFADEPTGNLDTRTTREVMELIKEMARENNQTIVMVTHDPANARYADRIIKILDGKIEYISTEVTPATISGDFTTSTEAMTKDNEAEQQYKYLQPATEDEAEQQYKDLQPATEGEADISSMNGDIVS